MCCKATLGLTHNPTPDSRLPTPDSPPPHNLSKHSTGLHWPEVSLWVSQSLAGTTMVYHFHGHKDQHPTALGEPLQMDMRQESDLCRRRCDPGYKEHPVCPPLTTYHVFGGGLTFIFTIIHKYFPSPAARRPSRNRRAGAGGGL